MAQMVKILPDLGLLSSSDQEKFLKYLITTRPNYFLKNNKDEYVIIKNLDIDLPKINPKTDKIITFVTDQIKEEKTTSEILLTYANKNSQVIEYKEGKILINTYKKIGPTVLEAIENIGNTVD